MSDYTRTHFRCLMYIETTIVDNAGTIDRRRMNDDDWAAVDDLVDDGLLIWGGTGLNPIFSFTDDGWAASAQLRRWRGEGNRVADFDASTLVGVT